MFEKYITFDWNTFRQARFHWIVDNSAPVQHKEEYHERVSRMIPETFNTLMESAYSTRGHEELFPILWGAKGGVKPDAVAWAEPFEDSDMPTPAIVRIYAGIGRDDEMAVVTTNNIFDEQVFYVGRWWDAIEGFVELRSSRLFESTNEDWVDDFVAEEREEHA